MSDETVKPKKKPVKKKAAAKKTASKTKAKTTKTKAKPRKKPAKPAETTTAVVSSPKSKKGSGAKAVVIILFIIIVLGGLAVFEFMGQTEIVDPVYEQNSGQNNIDTKRIRPSTVAGSFYPESKRLLQEEIYSHLISAENRLTDTEIEMLIVPHAGTKFSGPVAGYAYKTVAEQDYKRVIIFGPTHHLALEAIAVSSYEAWRTPLGEVDLDQANTALIDEELFIENDAAFMSENSVEVQIPFIQALYPEATIIPLAVGQLNEDQRAAAAVKIAELLDGQTLLLISSDLSHYLTAEEAEEIDTETIELIVAGVQEEMSEIDACGREAILIANLIAAERGWSADLLEYQHTGQVTGDDSRVIGYPALAYVEVVEDSEDAEEAEDAQVVEVVGLTEDQQDYLLDLARTTIEMYITEGLVYEPEEPEDEFLLQESGAFVTLNIDQELRGCIGHTVAQEALYLAVRDNAIAAATQDARFEAVTEDELDQIDIEVSVLTDPESVSLLSIQAGLDGVILTSSTDRSATYLPTVWESLSDPIEFMESLSEKAGLDSDAWLDGNITFERYRVNAFTE